MKRSLATSILMPALGATLLVGLLLLWVVPSRQVQELERSTVSELNSMAAAFAVSAQLAFEQQNLKSLGELSRLFRNDQRELMAAVFLESDGDEELLAEFPEGVNVGQLLLNNKADYIVASAPLPLDDFTGRVVILSHRSALDERMRQLTAPIYFSFAVIILIQLLLYRLLSRSVVAPIIDASVLADRLGTEDYGPQLLKVTREDELGTLLGSLRRLRTQLRLQRRQNMRLTSSLEDKVLQRTHELTKALEAKDKFLASVSHELRTPLHSIIASLDLLATSDTLNTENDERYVRLAKRGSVALMQLINELLDFQKLSQREVELYPEHQNLNELVAECIETAAILFEESATTFSTHLELPTQCWVSIDGHRLAQVLFNLVSNARKFTSGGSVNVTVRCLAGHDDHMHVQFTVSDTGIGMDEATVNRLGEAFFQSGTGLNRKYSGTGLGISIINRILAAMNSQLVIESQPGVGSTFGFELRIPTIRSQSVQENPFAVSARLNSPASMGDGSSLNLQEGLGTLSLLYVEDSETNRQVMAALLERFSVRLTMAPSAKEGYELIRSERFDLIVTDIQMPEYSGIDLNNWLKADPGANAGVPIYACTANVTKEAKDHYESLGFDGVLVKPVTLADLKAFLEDFIRTSVS